jgi:hypothetical protein
MFDATWSLSFLVLAALPLLCLAATGILAWVMVRKFKILRGQTEERLEELAGRLRNRQSRGDLARATGEPARPERPKADGGETCGSMLKPSAPPSREDNSEGGESQDSPTLIAIPNLTERDRSADPQAENALSQRHSEVWTLAAAGLSPEEIARQTGHPKGEVELIVGLYRQVRSNRGPLDHARSYRYHP